MVGMDERRYSQNGYTSPCFQINHTLNLQPILGSAGVVTARLPSVESDLLTETHEQALLPPILTPPVPQRIDTLPI